MDAIIDSLSNGSTKAKACVAAQITRRTFHAWTKKYPDFAKAVDDTITVCISVVQDALYKAAAEGDVKAQIHFLRCRRPEVWEPNRREQLDITTDGQPVLNMAVIRAEMAKQIELEQEALPEPQKALGEITV
jgi:hypothetical protein